MPILSCKTLIKMSIEDLKRKVAEVEYNEILEALKKTKFNKSKAAKLLGINRRTLYNKIEMHEKLSM